VNQWSPKEPIARVKGSKISQKERFQMIGERREVHFSVETPRDKSVQLAKASSLQGTCLIFHYSCTFAFHLGRPKQYAQRKQPVVKKGSWQQDDNLCGRRTRYLPPPRGRQEEVCFGK